MVEYEKENRKGKGVAFVLAVYAASRLFYLMAGGTDALGGLASRARCLGTLRHRYGSPIGSMNLLTSSGSRSRRPHSSRHLAPIIRKYWEVAFGAAARQRRSYWAAARALRCRACFTGVDKGRS